MDPIIENLESRLQFDATFHAKTGVVDVVGTGDGDTIVLQETVDSDTGAYNLEVFINTFTERVFDALKVKGIKVSGGSGPDNINAQLVSIPVTLDGGKGDDTLIGGSGPDKLIAGGGSNSLSGGAGNDLLVAGLQPDTIDGNGGNDRIIPDNTPTADDILSGGPGFDTVDYSASTIPVKAQVGANPKGSVANDVIRSDVEQIVGSRFADAITGATRHPLEIFGKGGNDTLIGGSGDDTLVGGAGDDSMLGMGGDDHFRAKDGEVDTLDGGSGTNILESADTLIVVDSVTNVSSV